MRYYFPRQHAGSRPLAAGAPAHHVQVVHIMHGVAFDYAPTYLRDAVVPLWSMPGRAHLRSADSGQYDVPRVSTSAGPRAFPVAGPLAWNQLPPSLRNMNCIVTFKRHLKTILFKAAYGVADNYPLTCNCVLTIAVSYTHLTLPTILRV